MPRLSAMIDGKSAQFTKKSPRSVIVRGALQRPLRRVANRSACFFSAVRSIHDISSVPLAPAAR
jgi:hypothetical protein